MIDLNTWNLSIPVGQPATTISTPALAAGFQDQHFKRVNGRLFFWVPISGTTTPNANYPRSELRETFPDGRVLNWTYPRSNHYLSAALSVSEVPSSGRVVIGQIHAYQQLTPMMKLEYRIHPTTGKGSVVAIVRLKPTGDNLAYTVANEINLKQRFTYLVALSGSGVLNVWINQTKWSTPLSNEWAPYPLYFKAGVYAQDGHDSGNEAGAAVFDGLRVQHVPY